MTRFLIFPVLALTLSLACLASPTDADETIPKWFSALDANASGAITLAEMQRARFGRFARRDIDRDGFLDKTELQGQSAWLQRFDWFDADRDGRISILEFENKGRERFAFLDGNNDGRVTLNEIKARSNAGLQQHTDRANG